MTIPYLYGGIKYVPHTKISEKMTEDQLSNCGKNSDLLSKHKSPEMLNSLKCKQISRIICQLH